MTPVRAAPQAPPEKSARWPRFLADLIVTAALVGLSAVAFVVALDPYGLRTRPGRPAGPIVDSNQRYMYPQVARSGGYDAAVFGSSTARLLDPSDLDAALGGRFANLAMNAATPYEQMRLARLFLAAGPPRILLFTLDATWCEADADRRRHTPLPFPAWLYEADLRTAALRQLSLRAVDGAGRVLLHRLGLVPARIRPDGFAVFTPPDAHYDAVRALAHIHRGATARASAPGPETAAMPALAWLDALLGEAPDHTVKIVAFMPVHAAAQGQAGTPRGAREAACKDRVAALGRRHGASVIDFRIPSPVTTRDENYWDALHYRLPVGRRVVEAIARARATGRDDPDGVFRVLAP